MFMIQRLGLIIIFLGGAAWPVQAVILDEIINVPEAVSDAYRVAVLDIAVRYGAKEACNWEEHEANINAMYDELALKAPMDMGHWIEQLCALAQELSRWMFGQQAVDTSVEAHDQNFIRFCCMLAASMLFQINYENYIKTWKEHCKRSSLLEEHKQNCLTTLQQINGHLEYNEFAESLTTYYYSIYRKEIPTSPVYYLPYEYLQCFSIRFMLQVLVKGYFHWNIIEQREAAGLALEDFCPDSDQRFEEDDDLQGQDDLHQIGMKRGKLMCCYKACERLKMVAQNREIEAALWNDIKSKINDFDGFGFVYSPIVLAGLAASSEDTANFLASRVLQNFAKMHGHFIYLIFSNPFTCIKQEALLAFAQHFMEEIVKEQANDWQHQNAEAAAWKKILGQE